MNAELFLAFVVASTVLVVVPGPNVTLIVATSLAHGARYALVTVAGTSSAMVIQLAVAGLGLTSLMVLLSGWFEWLRWVGVAYLLYLGISRWRAAPVTTVEGERPGVALSTLFWRGFLVSATNPKTLFFYAAFFPLFMQPERAPGPQVLVLGATFLVIATVLDGAYALLAGRVGALLRSRRGARVRNRLSGGLLILAGLGLALARRPP